LLTVRESFVESLIEYSGFNDYWGRFGTLMPLQ
jgi:hypothetical protein